MSSPHGRSDGATIGRARWQIRDCAARSATAGWRAAPPSTTSRERPAARGLGLLSSARRAAAASLGMYSTRSALRASAGASSGFRPTQLGTPRCIVRLVRLSSCARSRSKSPPGRRRTTWRIVRLAVTEKPSMRAFNAACAISWPRTSASRGEALTARRSHHHFRIAEIANLRDCSVRALVDVEHPRAVRHNRERVVDSFARRTTSTASPK